MFVRVYCCLLLFSLILYISLIFWVTHAFAYLVKILPTACCRTMCHEKTREWGEKFMKAHMFTHMSMHAYIQKLIHILTRRQIKYIGTQLKVSQIISLIIALWIQLSIFVSVCVCVCVLWKIAFCCGMFYLLSGLKWKSERMR